MRCELAPLTIAFLKGFLTPILQETVNYVNAAFIAKDRGISGAIEAPSAYFMKSPPVQHTDNEARQMVEDFIQGNGSKSPTE